MGFVLVLTGLTATGFGLWRGYAAARGALAPLIHEGEPTRASVEAATPLHAMLRVRLFVRRAAGALLWLLVGFYGLFLVAVGSAAR